MSGTEVETETNDSFYTARTAPDEATDWNPFKCPQHLRSDPYQVFKVEKRPCMVFEVKVVRGRNITKGWSDYVDTPDPYILLEIQTAPERRKRTVTKDNDVNPVWNESFTFLLDHCKVNMLQVSLMECNYIRDQTVGEVFFNINELPMCTTVKKTFLFNEVSAVDVEMRIYEDTNPTLRYSLSLCDEEKDFRERRKEKALAAMKSLLGERGPHNLQEVPTVAVLGSGGGFRAMVGFSGVFKALADLRVLDCATYVCGLSGSSWYISTLYSHPDWPNMKPGDMQEELKNNIDSSLMWLLKPTNVCRNLVNILKKWKVGQPVSFTDVFGHMVGETLIEGRMDSKLSYFQEKVKEGEVPLPLLACVHVKKDRSARSFQEWVEFSPHEVGIAKYGTFMPTRLFGSKFFLGKLCKEYEEPPLHFLQGLWGSAFCILFNRLLEDNRISDPDEMLRQKMERQHSKSQQDDSTDNSDDESEDDNDENNGDSEIGYSSGSSCDTSPAPRHPINTPKECGKIFCYSHHGSTGKSSQEQMDQQHKPVLAKQRSEPLKLKKMTSRRSEQKGYWHNFLKRVCENKNVELFSTRAWRAGAIHNFMRGLSLQESFLYSPSTSPPMNPQSTEGEFDGNLEMHPTDTEHLYMVDAGLTFNSPYPLVLRPQRSVDIILSFDFSARPSDSSPPFKELKLAEKWARVNRLPFPPIDTSVMDTQGMKELYIFRHPTDPHCPIVMHFILVNIEFRQFKSPGVPRRTEEEKAFADFNIIDDPNTPYATNNFTYTHEAFERLSKLMEFNTLSNIDRIKDCLSEAVIKKRTVEFR